MYFEKKKISFINVFLSSDVERQVKTIISKESPEFFYLKIKL